jgi:colanic acid/amylovoran biosynthesis glycosyltransferase
LIPPYALKKVAFFYATFPRPTETFVRRELRALGELNFFPDIYSIWHGKNTWESRKINVFKLKRLSLLFYWIPYWFLRKPKESRELLTYLWSHPCHSFQNWCETFLGLGYALVEANNFKKKRYELIHAVWATLPATAAFTIGKLVSINFSMGAHAYDVFRHGGDWLLEQKLKNATFVRTSSYSTARRLYQLGIKPTQVKLVKRSLSDRPKRRNFSLVDQQRLKLLSVGRLVEKKGYFHTLKIAALLKDSNIPFSLKIIGGGPLLSELQIEQERLGLIEEVSFLGSLGHQDVKKLYLQHDVFLFSGIVDSLGDRDGIPNVVPEALSAGMLVLASNRAGAPEAFSDGESGFSLNPENYQSWTGLLSNFWRNPSEYDSIRKKAEVTVRENFDSIQNGRSLLEVLIN